MNLSIGKITETYDTILPHANSLPAPVPTCREDSKDDERRRQADTGDIRDVIRKMHDGRGGSAGDRRVGKADHLHRGFGG
jgi:hypothetical protein